LARGPHRSMIAPLGRNRERGLGIAPGAHAATLHRCKYRTRLAWGRVASPALGLWSFGNARRNILCRDYRPAPGTHLGAVGSRDR
jgi:hypothetical protein